MNIKRIFGALLSVLGIIGLIYTAISFANANSGAHNLKQFAVYGLLSAVFFISGIGLVKTTKDES